MRDIAIPHTEENSRTSGDRSTAIAPPLTGRDRTPRLELPFGRTLGLSAVVFGLLLALGEGVVRAPLFRAHVVSNNRGGRHGQFELQLGRLETVVARDGPMDCVVLGNSMVWHDVDPEAFADGYRRQTAQDIRCFNFGVDGLPAVAAGAVAQVLIADVRPRLLIYGTTARDYVLSGASTDATVLLEMPWLQYRLGRFSIRGWLHEKSHLYRSRETLGQLLRLEGRHLLLTGPYASLKSTYGFYGREATAVSVDAPPDPEIPGIQLWGLFELLDDYQLLPEAVSGLEQVMGQNGPDIQIVIVEMPVPPTSYDSSFVKTQLIGVRAQPALVAGWHSRHVTKVSASLRTHTDSAVSVGQLTARTTSYACGPPTIRHQILCALRGRLPLW